MDETNRQDRLIFIAITLGTFIVGINLLSLAVAIDPLIKSFGIPLSTAQWLLTAFAIGNASFLVTAGKLSDLYDRKKVFAHGVLGFLITSLIIALSSNIWLIIAMRFLQGVCSGVMVTTAIAITNSYCPKEKRTSWIGGLMGATGLGLAVGPLVGGYLVEYFSWRAIFLANLPIGFVVLAIVFIAFPNLKTHASEEKLDFIGIILLALSIALLTIALSNGQAWGWLSAHTLLLIAASFALFFLLLFVEKRVAYPMMNFDLFGSGNFLFANVLGFVLYFLFSAWMMIFGFYLQNTLHVSPSHTGLYFMPFGLALLLISPLLSFLSKRHSNLRLINLGYFLSFIAFVGMLFLLKNSSLALLTICFALFGIGYTFVNSCSVTLALFHITPEKAGIGSGISMMLRWFGSAVGAALVTSLYLGFGIAVCIWVFIGLAFFCLIAGLIKKHIAMSQAS